MRKLICIFFISLIASAFQPVYVLQSGEPNTQNKIKSVFIYNFTKYIDWPKSYKEGNFIVGILGTTPFYKDLTDFLGKKTVGGTQPFQIKNFASVASIENCHILYIPANFTGNLSDVLGQTKGRNMLVVTEKAGMLKQGSAINFVVVDSKIKFELSTSNAEKRGLKVSSELEALAVAPK